jgi:hypothetical protein
MRLHEFTSPADYNIPDREISDHLKQTEEVCPDNRADAEPRLNEEPETKNMRLSHKLIRQSLRQHSSSC